MKKITAVVERASDGAFSVYTENEMFAGMGATADAAKADMIAGIESYLEFCKEENRPYPSFLDDDYEIVYQFDTQSLFEYYAGILTPAALERLTGINQKQISTYVKGTKPQKAQLQKIEQALHKLGTEFISISLT